MAGYLPLLSIDVAHAYYADGRCRGLRFQPGADTLAWLRANDALCRDTGSGLVVHAPRPQPEDPAAPPQLRRLAAAAAAPSPAAPATLSWTVRIEDPEFAAVTEGLAGSPDETLFFTQPAATPEADGALRLHAGATASQADAWPLRWPELSTLLTPRERRLAPTFVVRVAAPDPAAIKDPADPGPRWRIAFAARSTIWNYCLLGTWATDPTQIEVTDAKGQTPLGPQGEPLFAPPRQQPWRDGQSLWVIASSSRLALQERSERRLQLRQRSAQGVSILVERLPLAGAQPHARSDPGTLISEIFVPR